MSTTSSTTTTTNSTTSSSTSSTASTTSSTYSTTSSTYSTTSSTYSTTSSSSTTTTSSSSTTTTSSSSTTTTTNPPYAVWETFIEKYGMLISHTFTESYTLKSNIFSSFTEKYWLTDQVSKIFTEKYDLSVSDTITRSFTERYSMYGGSSEFITNEPTITLLEYVGGLQDDTENGSDPQYGREIDVQSISIESSEGSYCLSFSMAVSNGSDWHYCRPNVKLKIEFTSNIFYFVIDSRERTRSFGVTTYSVNGRQMTSRMDFPYANPVTKTWGDTTINGIVKELCYGSGFSFALLIGNWSIPSNVISSDGESPLSIIRKIADQAGAYMLTNFDGDTLEIRHKYEFPGVSFYDEETPDMVITDADDIISIRESFESKPGYNEIVIVNEESSLDDPSISHFVIEEYPDDLMVDIGFTVVPWTTLDVRTSSDDVTITYLGIFTEQLTESIQIINGNGSVTKPVYTLDTYVYNDTDLGVMEYLDYDPSQLVTETDGYSYVTVTYTYRYHKYRMQSTSEETAQFYVIL